MRPCALVYSSSYDPVASRSQLIVSRVANVSRRIRLHRHQIIGLVGFDDAAGGIPDRMQGVYRDDPPGNRDILQKRLDGGDFAALVVKAMACNRQTGFMFDQGCRFVVTLTVAVRAPLYACRRRR